MAGYATTADIFCTSLNSWALLCRCINVLLIISITFCQHSATAYWILLYEGIIM